MRMQFLNDWTFLKEGTGREIPVILPHDAMLSERRTDGEGRSGSFGRSCVSLRGKGGHLCEKCDDRPL